VQLYAHQVKGADQYLLGAMATATVVARVAFGIPLGRLADRIGRKRVIYILTPLWYASNILLVLAPNAVTLVLSAALQVFYSLSSGVAGAMTLELVPLEEQGKWSGVLGLFTGLLAMPAPILGGFIWRELGPIYVFLIPVAFDLLIRVPLLATVSETLMDGARDKVESAGRDSEESKV
jgi:MFS family permease